MKTEKLTYREGTGLENGEAVKNGRIGRAGLNVATDDTDFTDGEGQNPNVAEPELKGAVLGWSHPKRSSSPEGKAEAALPINVSRPFGTYWPSFADTQS
jgi:hypothetical protein